MARKRKLNQTTLIRRLVQLSFAALILVAAVRHNTSADTLPSTDALCPFGAVETLWTFITTGSLVSKTHPSNLVLGLGLLLGAVFAGASFCGWICPFGALNDLLTWIRKKLRLPELKIPARLDKILTYGRYVMLLLIPYMTVATAKLWFADYDPYRTIFSLGWLFEFNPAEAWPAYLIAVIIIVGGLFIPRFWCRYLCPQGLLLGWLQRISLFKITRNPSACTSCKLCDKTCPAKLSISTSTAVSGDCIGCLECLAVCPPKAGALSVNFILPKSQPIVKEPSDAR